MKSDLTCPVEIVRVTIQRETEDTNENGQILCLIDFFNLSDKVIDSIQMNIICFDAEDQRLGGRLVRAGAHGEPRENFSGAFAPEHVENVARVEAAVEKVFDLRPTAIIRDLDLRKPIYRQLAAYGHMGREELGVAWEKTDRVDALKAALGL